MRRFSVLLAMVMATSSFVALSGTALADEARPASFCGTAKNVAKDFEDVDPEDFTDAAVFDSAEKIYKKLAKEAPSSLKASFKTITKFYGSLKNADVTDAEDAEAFIEQSAKVGRALNKVIKYLSSKCKITFG